jgi:hypothetical protein
MVRLTQHDLRIVCNGNPGFARWLAVHQHDA